MRFAKRPPVGPTAASRVPVRAIVLAVAAVTAAAWGIIRHCSYAPPPLVRPGAPSAPPAPTYNADAGEIPVPEVVPSGQ